MAEWLGSSSADHIRLAFENMRSVFNCTFMSDAEVLQFITREGVWTSARVRSDEAEQFIKRAGQFSYRQFRHRFEGCKDIKKSFDELLNVGKIKLVPGTRYRRFVITCPDDERDLCEDEEKHSKWNMWEEEVDE